MSAEHLSSSAFGVEMKYNPEFLYTLLTRDNKPHDIHLSNNWGAIFSPNYDVFHLISLHLHSDLAASVQVGRRDRSTKVFWLEGGLWRVVDRELSRQGIQEKLFKLGVNTTDPLMTDKKSFRSRNYLITRNTNPNWALDVNMWHRLNIDESAYLYSFGLSYWKNNVYGVKIHSPKPISDLVSPQDISNGLNSAAEIFEKTIKVSYEVEEKTLPQQNLVFAPSEEEVSKQSNRISCGYCGSDYSIVQGLTCPQCGGSKPQFS